MQAGAREARYALAERHAAGDYAAGHTASDQAETVLYRLAVSPGPAGAAGHGAAARPARAAAARATREETRDHCAAAASIWREDPSNDDPRFARARVRDELLPALRELKPAAERTIAETARQLREEAEVLDAAVDEALERLGGGPAVRSSGLRREPPALARLVLRRWPRRRGRPARALARGDADASWRSAPPGGTTALDLGGGLRAVAEYGTLRFSPRGRAPPPAAVELAVPGAVRFGDWEVEARSARARRRCRREALGGALTVRALARGRPHPAGRAWAARRRSRTSSPTARCRARCGGRCRWWRRAGEIVWVAGVAVDERFAAARTRPGPLASPLAMSADEPIALVSFIFI